MERKLPRRGTVRPGSDSLELESRSDSAAANEGALTWDQVFGPLDARTASREERSLWLDALYRNAMGDKEFWISGGGEESMWTWGASVDAFLDGNWVAVILCCQATCERLLAGRFVPFQMDESLAPPRWESMGMGRLLSELELRQAIDPDFAIELRRLVEYRKPFGHWKHMTDPLSLFRRARVVADADSYIDGEEAAMRLVVADATYAITTTIELLYGDV